MESKQFTVGSRAFFSGMPDFKPKDLDYLSFIEKGNGFKNSMQRTDGNCCHFLFVRKPKDEMIKDALSGSPAMAIGKFLVPEIAKELHLTIQDLMKLQPLLSRLEPKHAYEKVIYEAYMSNGSFTLTDEQRASAFASYLAARQPESTAKE